MQIDLNCDLGEAAGNDADLLPLITSANVSCGAHAGTEEEITATLALAGKLGVAVGAHPGHPDRGDFGRRELPTPPRNVLEETYAQILALRRPGRSGRRQAALCQAARRLISPGLPGRRICGRRCIGVRPRRPARGRSPGLAAPGAGDRPSRVCW